MIASCGDSVRGVLGMTLSKLCIFQGSLNGVLRPDLLQVAELTSELASATQRGDSLAAERDAAQTRLDAEVARYAPCGSMYVD